VTDHEPGDLRRRTPRTSATYAVRAPLARWLRAEAAAIPQGARVLDVGCGVKPYEPWFRERASSYVGVDIAENPLADLVGVVEALPLEDGAGGPRAAAGDGAGRARSRVHPRDAGVPSEPA
jgi:hypothetical protein